mgnify:CR=1 FL=1
MPRKRQLAEDMSAEGLPWEPMTPGTRFERGPGRRTPHGGNIPLY